eukprot:Gb_41682 [translate_table: standard]
MKDTFHSCIPTGCVPYLNLAPADQLLKLSDMPHKKLDEQDLAEEQSPQPLGQIAELGHSYPSISPICSPNAAELFLHIYYYHPPQQQQALYRVAFHF